MLDSVHAYTLGEEPPFPSRWQPFPVLCTADQAHTGQLTRYLVKVRPNRRDAGRDAAAALISEVIGHGVAGEMGFRTHHASIVWASQSFAGAVNELDGYPVVAPGAHFGTVWLEDAADGRKSNLAQYAAPEELLRLWVMDSWLAVTDRTTDGNVLFLREKGKAILVPSDHSDCFDGAGRFRNDHIEQLRVSDGCASLYPGCETCIVEGTGCDVIADAVESARACVSRLPEIAAGAPDVWWQEAELDRSAVVGCLEGRATRLTQICQLDFWKERHKGYKEASSGGACLF